jgi:putative FmdB family regulatory protein
MPIFEYHCEGCGCDFEQLVLSSAERVTCPKCQGDNVQKLMSCCGHKSSGGKFVSSAGGGGCASCAGGSCSTCK